MTSTYVDSRAGGKLKRQPHRRHHSTPYARPSTQLSKSNLNSIDDDINNNNHPPTPAASAGWLSRIVDPARRLISTGATRFLPSVFSNSSSSAVAIPSPDPDENSDGDADCDDQDQETDPGSSRIPEEAEHIRSDSPSNIGMRKEDTNSIEKDSGVSEIEQLMRGKLFSRDEACRLTEILHSKAARNLDGQEEMRNVSKNRQSDPCIVLSADELPRLLNEENRENSNYATWEHVTATSIHRPTLHEEVGASPIDIARAYMGSISTGVGTPVRSAIQDRKHADQKDGFTSLPMLQPSSSKPSICWPGSRVQENRGYLTPQNPRSKYGLYSSHRSPYARTIDSKSNLKHQLTPSVDRPMNLRVFESPYRQTTTPGPTQDMDMAGGSVDGYGSVGPIRSKRNIRIQHTPFRVSTPVAPPTAQKTIAGRGTLPVFKSGDTGSSKNLSQFQQTSNNPGNHVLGFQSPHPHSSQMARRILDHIDKKVPTLREKTEEIRLASLGQKASLTKHTNTTTLPGKVSSAFSNDFTSPSLDSQKPLAPIIFGKAPNSTQAQICHTLSSDSQTLNTLQQNSSAANEGPEGYNTSTVSNQVNAQSNSATTSVSDVRSLIPAVMKGQQFHSLGNKRNLTSITINKPNPRSDISFGNSSGFTFPVPASSDSEPPTPSITPAKVPQQNEEDLSTPLFAFGSKKTSPNLVFSFTTTSGLTDKVDGADIKFRFGSDTANRISFSAADKNTVDTDSK